MADNYTLLYPGTIDWEVFSKSSADIPFSEPVVEYLTALSSSLLKDRESRLYPDVVTFAFFCRRANLLHLAEEFASPDLRLGRGTLFHIAPSNVPVNFAYTFVAGLLAGNKNIVRVSSKDFPQVNLIIRHIHLISVDFPEVASKLAFVRYDRTSDATAFFSKMADVRVIWGGDATIETIRRNPLPPRSFDVCFADRYSIAAIHPETIMQMTEDELNKLAEKFYNDTYLFDQNACSAPHLICWQKTPALSEAKERFWSAVHDYTAAQYNLPAVLAVDKLTALYRQSIVMEAKNNSMPDNFVVRTQLKELPGNISDFRCAGGYFSEFDMGSLNDIAPIITNRYQTMAYVGFSKEELQEFVCRNKLSGLDRIVPVGETTSFALNWDGYNLVESFTRKVSII